MYDRNNFQEDDCFFVSKCSCRNFPPQLRYDENNQRYFEQNWENDRKQDWDDFDRNFNRHPNNCRPNHCNCRCHDRCHDRCDHEDNCHNNRRKCCFGFFRCF